MDLDHTGSGLVWPPYLETGITHLADRVVPGFGRSNLYNSKVYVDLYSAFLGKAPQMRSDTDNSVLPANYTMPAFTPQPQNITALWLVLILPSHGGWKAESTWVVGYIPK